MQIQKIEDIEAWQRGSRLAERVYRLADGGKINQDEGLRMQMQRTVVSISSKIAYGWEMDSREELAGACDTAKIACRELEILLYIAQDMGYVSSTGIIYGRQTPKQQP